MKKLLMVVVAGLGLSGCVAVPYGGGYAYAPAVYAPAVSVGVGNGGGYYGGHGYSGRGRW